MTRNRAKLGLRSRWEQVSDGQYLSKLEVGLFCATYPLGHIIWAIFYSCEIFYNLQICGEKSVHMS